jgi:hypothetical protein
MPAAFNTQNLRGQSLLFRCLVTGFVTSVPALTRYRQGRGIEPTQRALVGERPSNWSSEAPTTVCEHCGMVVKGKPVGIQAAPTVQAMPESTAGGVMDHLNLGYLQLGACRA